MSLIRRREYNCGGIFGLGIKNKIKERDGLDCSSAEVVTETQFD